MVVHKLANGDVRTLKPTGKANEYRSKAGDRVVREFDGGDHVYKWKHRTIKVAMGGPANGGLSANTSHGGGYTATQPIHFQGGDQAASSTTALHRAVPPAGPCTPGTART